MRGTLHEPVRPPCGTHRARRRPGRRLRAPDLRQLPLREDEKTGTLRVWLFQEVDNQPKQRVVDAVLADFGKAHEGSHVTVEYIPVETRAQRVKTAFDDPGSAPDVIEYGNTDTAGYVRDGGLVDGRVYRAPYFVGIRALYYRTDVQRELGLRVATSQAGLTATAKRIRAAEPDLYGLAVGGAYTYGAMPFIWANGGALASGSGLEVRCTVRLNEDKIVFQCRGGPSPGRRRRQSAASAAAGCRRGDRSGPHAEGRARDPTEPPQRFLHRAAVRRASGAGAIAGVRAYRSVADPPQAPDLEVIAVPAAP
ncbi:hypothetical protein GCM10010521_67270 [Streptomyces rameus]|uniref:Extracellular solute-binding protein n=1 Tax=Streptomyces rameus TaxID=68261 RepID=A0ABN3V569_9ACTN